MIRLAEGAEAELEHIDTWITGETDLASLPASLKPY